MPPAARLTDMHVCPAINPGPVPHVGGPILPACQVNVLIGGLPAARVGDLCLCVGPVDSIVKGSMTVLIGGKPAARIGDPTAHGGAIVVGMMNVLIGDGGSGSAILQPEDPSSFGFFLGIVADAIIAKAKQIVDLFDNRPFEAKFLERTGIPLSDALAQYKADTGKDLSPTTVELLFTDRGFAMAATSADPTLHHEFRDICNSRVPRSAQEADAMGWTVLSNKQAAYHDPENNYKFVAPDGHREAVYSRADGSLVSSDEYKGTFNYFPPTDPIGHTMGDIVPYKIRGN